MTPEERASSIVGYLIGSGPNTQILENLRHRVILTIRGAVAEEREACAKNVEAMGPNEFEWAAAIIRQRGCCIPMAGTLDKEYILWKCPRCGYERKLINLVPGCSCDRDGCLTKMERGN